MFVDIRPAVGVGKGCGGLRRRSNAAPRVCALGNATSILLIGRFLVCLLFVAKLALSIGISYVMFRGYNTNIGHICHFVKRKVTYLVINYEKLKNSY